QELNLPAPELLAQRRRELPRAEPRQRIVQCWKHCRLAGGVRTFAAARELAHVAPVLGLVDRRPQYERAASRGFGLSDNGAVELQGALVSASRQDVAARGRGRGLGMRGRRS